MRSSMCSFCVYLAGIKANTKVDPSLQQFVSREGGFAQANIPLKPNVCIHNQPCLDYPLLKVISSEL